MQANGVVYDPINTCITRVPPNMTLFKVKVIKLHQSVAMEIASECSKLDIILKGRVSTIALMPPCTNLLKIGNNFSSINNKIAKQNFTKYDLW